MKLLLCADVRLGAVCAENLGVKLSQKWQAERTKKFVELIDKAAQNNAEYIALVGQIFGQERISESVIDSLFHALKENSQIQVIAFIVADEYNRLSYRNDMPENLHLICTQTKDTFLDQHIALRIDKGSVELQLADNDPVWIKKNADGRFVLSGVGDDHIIPSFEPIGFDEALETDIGYSVLEWVNENLIGCNKVANQKYAFRSVDLKILPEDGEKDIIRKIQNTVSNMDVDTFLRVTISGRSAFGLTLDSSALKTQLQGRVFFAEVYDNSIMDIDEEAFENDISLRSEFVRLALQDDSLSESERSRLISCGWNALNGREVSVE